MSTQSNKISISKLFGAAGIAGASLLLSFPSFALTPTSAESNEKNQVLAQQGGSGTTNQSPRPEGDQTVPTAPSPSDPSVDEVTPADPVGGMENNQMQMNETPSAGESNQMQMNERPAARETNQMNEQYSGTSDRLRPGSWLCLNNPNPQCDS